MKLNTVLVLQLADFVAKRTDLEFQMLTHSTCYIGFLKKLVYPDVKKMFFSSADASELLGLSDTQRMELFFPRADETITLPQMDSITREMAVETLHGLAYTGKVEFDWSKVKAPREEVPA